MRSNSYQHSLEPSGDGREYHICPQCNHKTFTLYINNDTGEYIAPYVGRCERINSCRYHYSPYDYFYSLKKNNMENNENVKKEETYIIKEEKVMKRYSGEKEYILCSLFCFFVSVFGRQSTLQVFQKYEVRVTKRFRDGIKYGTAFVQRAIDGTIRQVKEMAYRLSDGKRIKDNETAFVLDFTTRCYVADNSKSKIYQAGKSLMKDYDFRNKQCFFGEHLLADAPRKAIAIVESEKTALIGDICLPDYTWLATGGINGCKWLTEEVYQVLKETNLPIILFPDLNAIDDWKAKAEMLMLAGLDISVFDWENEAAVTEEDRKKGLDIGDYLIRYWKEKYPEAGEKIEEIKYKKANIPQLSGMLSALSTPKQPNIINHEDLGIEMDLDEVDSLLKKKDKPVAAPQIKEASLDDIISDIQ